MLRKICVSMTQISHSELTREHPFRYGKKCISALRNLDFTRWVDFQCYLFIFFFSIDSKGKKAPNLSQIFKTSVENVLGNLLDCKMRCPAGQHEQQLGHRQFEARGLSLPVSLMLAFVLFVPLSTHYEPTSPFSHWFLILLYFHLVQIFTPMPALAPGLQE